MGILQESKSPRADYPCLVDDVQRDSACSHQPSPSTTGIGLILGTDGAQFWDAEQGGCDFESVTSSSGLGRDSSCTTRDTRFSCDTGIIPRALYRVFEHVASASHSVDISVKVSLLQIYN